VDEARARLEARRAAALASRADLAAARSTHRMTQREVERVRRLVTHDYVSRRELDAAEAAFESAVAGVEAAERRFAQAEREAQQAEAELAARRHGVDQSRQRVAEARAALARSESQVHQVSIKDAEASRALARLKQAQADLAFAQLQLDHAEVRAPLDGIVSKKSAEPGQVVQPGQPLLALVPLHDVWVVANFKETQLRGIRPGMPAQVTVDTYPGRVFTGAVDSLAAGTGSRFSLLPPENATGNWVKVVQRVPVKIRIEGGEIGNPQPLRAGMSAVVTIRIR
jgi:membrane fusion protein (multidrug efflux system)